MTASPPSDTNASQRKWLPWIIGLAVVFFLAWWMRGCGKVPEAGVVTDTTQSMMAPEPAPPAPAEPAPTPAQAAIPRDTAPVAGTTGTGPRIKETARTDTAKPVPAAAPDTAPSGPGAMGGRGEPGKKPSVTTP